MARQADLIDLIQSRAARDAGLQQVTDNAVGWFDEALACIETLHGWRGTGEDLRLLVTASVGKPHSPNVWGALVMRAERRKLIAKTGQRVPMRSLNSHARQTDVYRSTY